MIEVLGIAVLCNMLTHWFTPIQGIKQRMLDKLPLWLGTPFICSKCAGFWFGSLYFLDPLMGALTSLAAYLVDNLIWFIEERK